MQFFFRFLAVILLYPALAAADPLKARDPVVLESPGASQNLRGAPKKKLIFVNFYNTTGNKNTRYLENSISDSIHELIKNKYRYERVRPDEWQNYAKTNAFQEADFFDIVKLQKMGYALKADGIIFGKIAPHTKGVVLTGKILSVVDKEVIAEKELVAPLNAEIFKGVNEISETLAAKIKDLFLPSDTGALWRSALLPGWGQFYKQRPGWGKIYAGTVGTTFAFTITSFVLWQVYNAKFRSFKPEYVLTPQGETPLVQLDSSQAEFDRLLANSENWKQMTLISGGVTLFFYLVGLIDAYFIDGEYKDAFSSKQDKISRIPFEIRNSGLGDLSLAYSLRF